MGPLKGMKVVEMAGIGPGPFCASLFADLGATVIRIDRPVPSGLGTPRPLEFNLAMRSRPAIKVNLKKQEGIEFAMTLIERADALIEGFRPGVMERLGLGPEDCFTRNPKLVFGRMTGWGQEGPMANAAGHDLNYIALTGALHATGQKNGPPTFPMNLLGDFGGGAMYLAFGVMSAIYEAQQSGKGQVVDCAMVDGVASLMTSIYGMFAGGLMTHERGTNSNDSGAHFYNVYECKDGEWVSIAAIEPKFYEELLGYLGISQSNLPSQRDREHWPKMKALFASKFITKTREEWRTIMEGTDACFAPVLTASEAPEHPHFKERGTFVNVAGVPQPLAAPLFSRTKLALPTMPVSPVSIAPSDILGEWMDDTEIEEIIANGGVE
ncbi:MAG: CoA transferase [Pirellulales bacterium]|nr:carnitine dehydratase [Rhodospirillaceae bacterium]MCH2597202.1 CoA transferase [Pirellulales bacterium]